MNKTQTRKFIDAAGTAGIANYQFDTDLGSHLYNNDHAIIKFIDADEIVYNIRDSHFGGSHNSNHDPLQVVGAWCEDLHEARIAGTYSQIKTFLETLGVTLSDSDLKIMIDIENMNVDIIPATGDYNRFSPLTKKQYDALTDEEKAKYDADKKAADEAKAKYIGQHSAASITLG